MIPKAKLRDKDINKLLGVFQCSTEIIQNLELRFTSLKEQYSKKVG